MNDYRKHEPFFGSWYLGRQLGEGSFGIVFEIEKRGRTVGTPSALKIISIPDNKDEVKARLAAGLDPSSVAQYYESVLDELTREIEIMSDLKGNTNIVNLEDYDVFEHEDGIGYDLLIKMELLTPLRTRMADMDVREIVRLGIDICRALELCHQRNIVHRDIKPSNIFISKNGDYKLGDFGIARTMEKANSELSRKGTFNYMAPEIYLGSTNYDHTVDIYSLGIVLYTLLNGNRIPFLPKAPLTYTLMDEQQAKAKRFSGTALPPLNIDRELDGIIRNACAFRPEDRYQTAYEMRRELEDYYRKWFDGESLPASIGSRSTDRSSERSTEETLTMGFGDWSGSGGSSISGGSSGSSGSFGGSGNYGRSGAQTGSSGGFGGSGNYSQSGAQSGNYGSSGAQSGNAGGRKKPMIAIIAVLALVIVIGVAMLISKSLGHGRDTVTTSDNGSQTAQPAEEAESESDAEGEAEEEGTDSDASGQSAESGEEDSSDDSVIGGMPEGTVAFNGHYYMVYDEPMYWHDAKDKCEQMGGHLCTITSEEEQQFIVSIIEAYGSQKQYWLGGTDEDSEGIWYWITGEPFEYTNWKTNPDDPENKLNSKQPNNAKTSRKLNGEYGQDYLCIKVTNPGGEEKKKYEYMTWNDTGYDGVQRKKEGPPNYCSTEYYGYICEWE